MKKCGIITHYDVHNHGAHLQLYALSRQLKLLGYDAKALRYKKNYDFMGGDSASKKYYISLWSIPIYVKYTISNGIKRTIYNIKKRALLARFRDANCLVGGFYSEAKDLFAVVIGSDEIFSIEAGPNPWYYGIGVPCKRQFSYAASFGPTTVEMIEEHNVSSFIKGGLSNIKKISVRDENSADIIEYYTGNRPPIVCDPVLLYDFSSLLNKKNRFRKIHPEKYCIVYSYDYNMNDEETVKSIKRYAYKRGLKVYSIGYYHSWCDGNININPLEMLHWFNNAEVVFTDTFHGSVISLATNTQFWAKIEGNNYKLGYLLEQYNVLDRGLDTFAEIERKMDRPIDYKKVEIVKRAIRKESLLFLRNSLDEMGECY